MHTDLLRIGGSRPVVAAGHVGRQRRDGTTCRQFVALRGTRGRRPRARPRDTPCDPTFEAKFWDVIGLYLNPPGASARVVL